ncbi:hypothetical protein ACSS6W_010910 [Trichoderma asperelloides]
MLWLTNRLQIPRRIIQHSSICDALVYTRNSQKPHTTYHATTSTSPPNSAARLCFDLLNSTVQKSIDSKVGKKVEWCGGLRRVRRF